MGYSVMDGKYLHHYLYKLFISQNNIQALKFRIDNYNAPIVLSFGT